jgi:hypothetical protein
MAQQTMNRTQADTSVSNAAYNRHQAMQVWGTVRPMNRVPVHPMYAARRMPTGRSLAHSALGILLVLSALVLMANV